MLHPRLLQGDIDSHVVCGCLSIPIAGAKALIMAALTSVYSLHGTRRSRRGIQSYIHPKELPSNRLLLLPLEILHLIVDQLNLIDAVCLSLTCRRLHRRLESHRHILQKLSKGQRFDLHFRITQHLPGVFYCHLCSKLHDVRKVGPPGPLFYRPRGESLDCLSRVHRAVEWPLYQLNFCHVQLVMQNHRNIQTGTPIESLYFRQVIEIIKDKKRRSCHPDKILISVEPKIVDGRLFLRRQHWEIYRRADVIRLRRHGCVVSRFNIESLISQKYSSQCSHGMLPRHDIIQMLMWVLRFDLPDEYAGMAKEPEVVTHKCDYCGVECEWTTHPLGIDGDNVALITTRWMPFGDGRSPYPILRFGEAGWPWFDRVPGEMRYEGPDARSLFDDRKPQHSLAGLIRQNESCLNRLRYKESPFVRMYHLGGSCRSWVEQIDVDDPRKQYTKLFADCRTLRERRWV